MPEKGGNPIATSVSVLVYQSVPSSGVLVSAPVGDGKYHLDEWPPSEPGSVSRTRQPNLRWICSWGSQACGSVGGRCPSGQYWSEPNAFTSALWFLNQTRLFGGAVPPPPRPPTIAFVVAQAAPGVSATTAPELQRHTGQY